MDDDDNNDKNHVGYTLLLTWLYNENVFGWIQYVLKTRQGVSRELNSFIKNVTYFR